MTESIRYHWRSFDQLTTYELYDIIKAREAVFVVEQECPYQETDEMDLESWHLQLFKDKGFAAYARVVKPGVKCDYPSIGRVLTVANYRGLGLGRLLMKEAIAFCHKQYPQMAIQISAQTYLQTFYQSLGFTPCSDVYDEDGIEHIDMLLNAHK